MLSTHCKTLTVPTANGHEVQVIAYTSSTSIGHTIVISSATGVLQKYYSKFAQYAASKGFTVYTFDYGGIGLSLPEPKALKTYEGNLRSWGSRDQAAVIAFAKKENEEHTLTLIGHSIGGQLLGFNGNHSFIDKVVLVASQSGYWKLFNGIHCIKMWLFWYVLIPLLTPLYGYFPAKKLGLFENLPKQMVYEWAAWGRKKDYMLHDTDRTDHYFEALKIPILALSFYADSFAPQKMVDWMAAAYKNAQVSRIHYNQTHEERQAKHFGFFKSAYKEVFWDTTLEWIRNNSNQ